MAFIEKLRNLRTRLDQEHAEQDVLTRNLLIEDRRRKDEIERIKENNKRISEELIGPYFREINKEFYKGKYILKSEGEIDYGRCTLINPHYPDGIMQRQFIDVKVQTSNNLLSITHYDRTYPNISTNEPDWKIELEGQLMDILSNPIKWREGPRDPLDDLGGFNG